MVQITERDEALIAWLSVVRVADMDAIRWALGALSGAGAPVSLRRAQQRIAILQGSGLVDRSRPTFRDGSIVWATHQATGKTAPNLFRQTTRHEVAVATVSARYLAHGYSWRRDRKPRSPHDHQADGVAVKGDQLDLIEVELTPKTWQRYKTIMNNHVDRFANEGVSRVVYFCTADAERAVTREADKWIFRTERGRLVSMHVFDVRGKWVGDEPAAVFDAPDEAGARLTTELDGSSSW